MLTRRQTIGAGLSLPFASPSQAETPASAPIAIADMHFHSFFGGSRYHARPIAETLASAGATLVAWALVGDLKWFEARGTYPQTGVPTPAEARGWFKREAARVKAHVAEQGLELALTAGDVDRAMAGRPHIVLAVEGATFITRPDDVKLALDAGVRHLQLVHFIASPLGDFQTRPATHDGLTGLGREVIAECNRLGILVDLAHASPATAQAALSASKAPVVWSHSSVTRGGRPHPGQIVWRARQLALEDAKAIAAAGGVVGLWMLDLDVGKGPEAYARRLVEAAEWLGDEHVAFGTDFNGLGAHAGLTSFAELREVVAIWQRLGVPERRVRRIAGENYARVLKRAMSGRQA
jgi:membrane dipeptidase